MDWQEYAQVINNKILYKGIDIPISREILDDLNANGIVFNYLMAESMYKETLSLIRDNKIDNLLK
jgi:hypothetical protein